MGLALTGNVFSQAPGTIDTNYPVKLLRGGYATKVITLPGDKLLVVGFISEVSGFSRFGVVRLMSDGTLDPSFDPATGASDGYVDGVFMQPDGKFLICGRFQFFNNQSHQRFVRLNSDGTIDPTLATGTGFAGGKSASSLVYDAVTTSDGSIIVAGDFTRYNGVNRTNLAKLSSTGTLDNSFNPIIVGGSFQSYVRSITVETNGKIFITGAFTNVNAASRFGVARLNGDGTLDPSFDPGTGAAFSTGSQGVLAARLLTDGKYLITGDFTNYNGTARNRIARLNSDGSLDTIFDPGSGFDALAESDSLEVLADGRLLVGGNFKTYNGTTRNSIARLNADGGIDLAFDTGTGPLGTVFSITRQSGGDIVIGGSFRSVNGAVRFGMARLSADGVLDPAFQPELMQTGSGSFMVRLADGKTLIAGDFQKVGSIIRNSIARLNADGLPDASFGPAPGNMNGFVNVLGLRPDGKIVAAGPFVSVAGLTRNRVALFSSDGVLDTSFDPGTGPSSVPAGLVVQADNKIILAGSFTNIGGFSQSFLGRLMSDGSPDTNFTPIVNAALTALAAHDDGRLVVGGVNLTSINTTAVGRIARVSAEGVLDPTFTVGTISASSGAVAISALRARSDGTVWVSGNFSTIQAKARNGFVRLNSDGTVDDTFVPATLPGLTYIDIQFNSEGRIIVAGNSSFSRAILRLNADGSLNTVFQTNVLSSSINRLAMLPNDDILVASPNLTFNGFDIPTFRRLIEEDRTLV